MLCLWDSNHMEQLFLLICFIVFLIQSRFQSCVMSHSNVFYYITSVKKDQGILWYRERHMLMRKSGAPTKRTLRCGWRVMQAYSPEMQLEEGKEKLGRVLSSHALRSMWSGIKAQQNGMKELITSTVRYRNREERVYQEKFQVESSDNLKT